MSSPYFVLELGKAAVMGLVEGVTEFIPVSSTGHLILAGEWLNFHGESSKTFEIFIQLGAILAVVWLYRDRVVHSLRDWRRDAVARRLILNLIIAFIPAAVVGVLIHGWIKAYLFGPLTVALALVVGGFAILGVERFKPTPRLGSVDDLPYATAWWIGVAQVLALFPGVSRSGATIMGGLGLGLSRTAATEFSFFLAIPVMFAATLFDLGTSLSGLQRADIGIFAVGFLVSFFSAVVVVKAFLRFVSRHTFIPFAWYRIALGAAMLALYWR